MYETHRLIITEIAVNDCWQESPAGRGSPIGATGNVAALKLQAEQRDYGEHSPDYVTSQDLRLV